MNLTIMQFLILLYLAVSSPPIITSVSAVDTHSVRVDWMIPNRINGIIIYYTISYVTNNGVKEDRNVSFNGQPVSFIWSISLSSNLIIDPIIQHNWTQSSISACNSVHHCY